MLVVVVVLAEKHSTQFKDLAHAGGVGASGDGEEEEDQVREWNQRRVNWKEKRQRPRAFLRGR